MGKSNILKRKTIKTNTSKNREQHNNKQLKEEGVYNYLGVNESNRIQHATMKEKIRKECYQRVRAILKTEVNSANQIEAINTLVIL